MLVAVIDNEERYFTYHLILGLDTDLIAEMRDKFESYHKRKVIFNQSFDDNTWVMSDEKRQYTLDFSLLQASYQFVVRQNLMVAPEQMVLACKVYATIQFGMHALNTIRASLRALYQLLDKLITQDIQTALRTMPPFALHALADFFPLLDSSSETILYIQEVLDEIPPAPYANKRRSLAPFVSCFRFSDVMTQFWAQAGSEQKIRFFPLWLWWNLTTILPLRPTEFTLIPRECLSYTTAGQAEKGGRCP